MNRLVVRPAAAVDIASAFAWYQRERPELGLAFLTAFLALDPEVAGKGA